MSNQTNTPSKQTQPPYLLHIRSHTNFILVTVVLNVFIDSFLYGLILPVIPLALPAQTGEPESQRQVCCSKHDTAGPSIGLFMDYISIALSGGLLVSPLIVGVLYETHGYYSVYSVAFALIVLDILPEVVEDSAGSQSDSSASSASDAAGEQEKKIGVAATTAAAAPAQLDAAPKGGLANHHYVRLIRSPRMLAALTGVAVHAAVIVSLEVTVPLFVKNTYGWNSTAAGLVLLASMLPSLLSPVIGAISDKYGAKWPSFIGFLLSIPVLACLRFAEIDSTLAQKVTLVALLTVLGITMGMVIEIRKKKHRLT
ncbi:hypothetical protein RB597_003429 [Gaeumannomyces tritici]